MPSRGKHREGRVGDGDGKGLVMGSIRDGEDTMREGFVMWRIGNGRN
jgi:hypothetical protein